MKLNKQFEFWNVTQGDHKELLSFLIKTKEDLHEFMEEFYSGDAIRSMIRYQRYKRKLNRPTLLQGEKEFEENKKEALEQLFQEPIKKYMLNYMLIYNLSYKDLYYKLDKRPNDSYLTIIKVSDCDSSFSDDFLFEL